MFNLVCAGFAFDFYLLLAFCIYIHTYHTEWFNVICVYIFSLKYFTTFLNVKNLKKTEVIRKLLEQ